MIPLGSFTSVFLSPLTRNASPSLSMQQKKTVVVAGVAVGCLIAYFTFKRSYNLQIKDLFQKKFTLNKENENLNVVTDHEQEESPIPTLLEKGDGFDGLSTEGGEGQSETLLNPRHEAVEEEEPKDSMFIQEFPRLEQKQSEGGNTKESNFCVSEELEQNKQKGDQSPSLESLGFELVVPESSFPSKQDQLNIIGKLVKKLWQFFPSWTLG